MDGAGENQTGVAEYNYKGWADGGKLGKKVLEYSLDSVDELKVTKDDAGYHFTIPAIHDTLTSSGIAPSAGSGSQTMTYSMEEQVFISDGPTERENGWEYVFIQEKPANYTLDFSADLDRRHDKTTGEQHEYVTSRIKESGSFQLIYLVVYNPGGEEGDYAMYSIPEEMSEFSWSVDGLWHVEYTDSKHIDDKKVNDSKVEHMFEGPFYICDIDEVSDTVIEDAEEKPGETGKDIWSEIIEGKDKDGKSDPDIKDPVEGKTDRPTEKNDTVVNGGNTGGNNSDIKPEKDHKEIPVAPIVGVAGVSAIVGIGGATAVAGGGAAGGSGKPGKDNRKNDQGKQEQTEEEKKKKYRIKIYKDFGNAMSPGTDYYVFARIVEVAEDGRELNHPGLSAKIQCFSGDRALTVADVGMSKDGAYKTAKVSVPKDSNAQEGQVSFRYSGPGGSFTYALRFFISQPKDVEIRTEATNREGEDPSELTKYIVEGKTTPAKKDARDMSLDEIYTEDTKDYSQYRMVIYKKFGDFIRKGEKNGVWVLARIEEVRPVSDHVTFRDDLTEKIQCFSGDGVIQVSDEGLTNSGCSWKNAYCVLPEDVTSTECLVSFRFTGPGGTYTRHVVFRVAGEPEIRFPVLSSEGKILNYDGDNEINLIAGDEITYEMPFTITDAPKLPSEVSVTNEQGLLNCSKQTNPKERMTYYALMENLTESIPLDDFFPELKMTPVKIVARFDDQDYPEIDGQIRANICPSGLFFMVKNAKVQDGRLVVDTVPNEHAGQGLEEDIKPTYFDVRVAWRDRSTRPSRVVLLEDFTISFGDLNDDGQYGDMFTRNFSYRMGGRNGSYSIIPKVTLPMSGDPYKVSMLVKATVEDTEYERELPLLICGEHPSPMPEEWQREYDALRKDIRYFGIGNVKGISEITRNAKAHTANELNMVRRVIIKEAMNYYMAEAAFYADQAAFYDKCEWTANIIKWIGDQAFSYLITTYAGGPFVEAVLSPMKDIFCELAGEYLSQMIDGTEIEFESSQIWGTVLQISENCIGNVLTGDNPPTPKNLGYVVAGFLIVCYFRHYYCGEEEKGDIYKSLLAATNDLAMNYVKNYIGNLFKGWVEKSTLTKSGGIGNAIGKYLLNEVDKGVNFENGLDALSKYVEETMGFVASKCYDKLAETTIINPDGVNSVTFVDGYVLRFEFKERYVWECNLIDNIVTISGWICESLFGWFTENAKKVPVESCMTIHT
ncbi:MAG: hypothetical protein K6B72_07495 [Lachnospiraceae bacterium]|nr:hypothetical protein [Lachnospiraceae bacterium]